MANSEQSLSFSEKAAQMGSEDFPRERVPYENRIAWPYITFAWFGAAMFVGLYYTGVTLGTQMGNVSNALTAIFIGAIFLAAFLILNGLIGQKTGCNAALNGTYAYGIRGVAIPGFHITDIGWYIVMTSQFVFIVHSLWPIVDKGVYAAIFSLLFLTNGFVGFRQMARLNSIAMPILLFTGLFGLYKIAMMTPGGLGSIMDKTFPNTISIAAAVTIVVGTWASGTSRASDYFRWARTKADVFKAGSLGFFGGYIICIVVGCFWGAGTGSVEIQETLVTLNMVGLGMLMFFLQTWTTNEHSGYVTSLALPVFTKAITGTEIKRRRVTEFVAAISIFMSGLGIERYFIPFISLLGILLPCIASIVIFDFYILSKTKMHWTGHYDIYSMDVNSEDIQHHIMNWAVVPALIIGFMLGWKLPWGIGAINSLIGTGVMYLICTALFNAMGARNKEIAKNQQLAK